MDHGKSTLLGRLLADTGNVPGGKIQEIKERCAGNSKAFEYAFLLDALKEEQRDMRTVDMARCTLKGKDRDYTFIDVPGHTEFLRSMVSGAARAEAALIVIDAREGIKENSRRHGYLISMLGIGQLIVCVNKMDLVGYSKSRFEQLKKEYSGLLANLRMKRATFIPVAAYKGENIVCRSRTMKWYKGPALLRALSLFVKTLRPEDRPFRMPVQDVYSFADEEKNRKLIAGRIEAGKINVGDRIIFYPYSGRSTIKSIEMFNSPGRNSIGAGYSISFTLSPHVRVIPGEVMCRERDREKPAICTAFRANLLWMGEKPLVEGRTYKLKIAALSTGAKVTAVKKVMDTSSLATFYGRRRVNANEAAECEIETTGPVVCDLISKCEATGRFVLVDGYEIAGGGMITAIL